MSARATWPAILILVLPLAAFAQRETSPGRAAPVISNRFGEPLKNARILKFDGETFTVEHDGGVAAVSWAQMPEGIRRAYPRDPGRAAGERERNEERAREAGALAAQEAAAAEAAETPEPTPAPTPVIIERDIRLGDLYSLSTIGGPPVMLRISRISQTEITFSRDRYGSETVPRKLGFNEPRTLLFSDGQGCDVYWVERVDPTRDRYTTTIQFEYAPNARSRPR